MLRLVPLVALIGCTSQIEQTRRETQERDAKKAKLESYLATRPPEIQNAIRAHQFVPGMVMDDAILAAGDLRDVCNAKKTTTAHGVTEDAAVCTGTYRPCLCERVLGVLHFKDGVLVSIEE